MFFSCAKKDAIAKVATLRFDNRYVLVFLFPVAFSHLD
jgi:hypothetical protein